MKKAVLGYDWDETFDALPYQENGDVETGSTRSAAGTNLELTSVSSAASSNMNQDDPLTVVENPKLVKRNNSKEPLRPVGTLT
jgi:hypothetical protein